MDNNEAKNHPRPYDSLEHLIKDTCILNQAQLEKELEWAERVAKMEGCSEPEKISLSSILIPSTRGFQDLLEELKRREITPKLLEDFSDESQKIFTSGDFGKIKGLMAKKKEIATSKEELAKVHVDYEKGKGEDEEDTTDKEKLNVEKDEKIKCINIDRDKDLCKGKGARRVLFFQRFKTVGMMAACLAVAAVIFLFKPELDVVGRRSYEYRPRVRNEEKGDIVWNNQEDYSTELGQLEKAYAEIKERLGIIVLKLNYIPEGVVLSNVVIEERHARLEFINQENFLYVLEVIYPVDDSANRYSDRAKDKEIYNEWMGKWIPIQKNCLNDNRVEYSAYFENENAYYYLQGIIEEDEFIHIVENLTLEIN